MTETEQTPKPVLTGPIEVKNAKGEVVVSIGQDVIQADGIPSTFNIAGTPYETFAFMYKASTVEEIEDFGYAVVQKAFTQWAEQLLTDEDLYSIEWRVRPSLELGETRVDVTILDAETGKTRPGVEVVQTIMIRTRLVVHKRSARPDSGLFGRREGQTPWLKAEDFFPKAVAA